MIPLSSPRGKESPTLRREVAVVHSAAKSALVAASLEPLAILFVQCAFRPEELQTPLLRGRPGQTGPAPSFSDEADAPSSRSLFVSPNVVQSVAGSAAKTLPLPLKP